MNVHRQVVLDTETTGLDWRTGDRVIEIGCVELRGRQVAEARFHCYLNPEREVAAGAVSVHGLTDEFLADKPRFAEVVDRLLAFLRDAEIVIHNAGFDVGFVNAELARLGREPIHTVVGQVTDTLAMAREMFPGKANSLDALCKRLEVDNSNRSLHGALLDAGLLAEVYIRMTRGQDTLVIAHESGGALGAGDLPAVDLSTFELALVEPTAEELAAHEAVLADLDKASGGKSVWRPAVA